jgi:hypothetical protein
MTRGEETSYNLFATITPQVNDVYNREVNKYISGLSRPFMNVIAASYTTPRVSSWNKVVSTILGDWQISTVLRWTVDNRIRVPGFQQRRKPLARRAQLFANTVQGQPRHGSKRQYA